MKNLVRRFAFALPFCLFFATSTTAANLPTQEQVETAMKRTLGYDPALTWQIMDIRQSVIPGVADVIVSINKQATQHIYFAPDQQNAIIGEIIPFGANPFAPARSKLSGADGPSRGATNPVIQIVVFSEPECPHCKAAQPVLDKLAADFPQVRFVFQLFPLPASMHPWAMKGAEYADCAGQQDKDAFWKYIDAIFENQDGITPATAEDTLKGLASSVGLDAGRLSACAASPDTEARVKNSLALGQSMDVTSIPTVFINGRRVLAIATIPYGSLKELVQFEIDHAGR